MTVSQPFRGVVGLTWSVLRILCEDEYMLRRFCLAGLLCEETRAPTLLSPSASPNIKVLLVHQQQKPSRTGSEERSENIALMVWLREPDNPAMPTMFRPARVKVVTLGVNGMVSAPKSTVAVVGELRPA